ncbi:MAG: molybdopterin cofactor-binding domain-containing protein [Saprospiraceae bacterium]
MTFFLDGEKMTLSNVSPKMRLIDFLHLPNIGKGGTKISCGQGGCGACTVMLTSYDSGEGTITNKAINSCLRPLATLDGTLITTTQGIGNVKNGVDEVQWTIAANNGSQCGYCTPGFVMNMFTRMQEDTAPSMKEVEGLFDGNICRCTGYRPILDGFKKLANDYQPSKHEAEIIIDPNYQPDQLPHSNKITVPDCFVDYMKNPESIAFTEDDYYFFRPTTPEQLLNLLDEHGPVGANLQLMSGNTAIGIYPTKSNYNEAYEDPRYIVDITAIKELQEVNQTDSTLTVGGQITITRFLSILTNTINKIGPAKNKGLIALEKHLEHFGNLQVRNEGTLAGNIFIGINKGFLSDLTLVLATLGATVNVVISEELESIPILDLPKMEELPPNAFYHSITIPFSKRNENFKTFKIRRRVENCHAIVNAGFKIALSNIPRKKKAYQVEDSHFVINGINADYKNTEAGLQFTPIVLTEVSNFLQGEEWNENTLRESLNIIQKELIQYAPPKNKSGQGYEINQIPFSYRKSIVLSLFYKFFVQVCKDKRIKVSKEVASLNDPLHQDLSHGVQYYNSYEEELPVSAPFVKLAAFMQATGEANFTSSVIPPPKTLEAAFVYSTISKGTFHYCLPSNSRKKKECSKEELVDFLKNKYAGFKDLIGYQDINENNRAANWGGLGGDDPLFVPCQGDEIPSSILEAGENSKVFFPKQITSIGAPLAIAIANSESLAQEVAEFVRLNCIQYDKKRSIDIERALRTKHYFPQSPSTNPGVTHIEQMVQPGNDAELIKYLEDLAEGKIQKRRRGFSVGKHSTGYQNHFYMETMTALVIPGEGREVSVYTTTQNMPDDQQIVANILGLSMNDVKVLLYRLGGGFGGRQSRSRFVTGPVAIASRKHNRPVRLKMSREDNFIMCGNRHPYYGNFATSFEPSGKINGLLLNLISNGGNTYDLSFPVMDLSVNSSENVYNIENLKITGNVCQTNEISNTAFRAFGLVQSMNILEECIERTAFECGISPDVLRERNFYKDGQTDWTSFKITERTLAILDEYGFDKQTLEDLEPLQGKLYKDEAALDTAIKENEIDSLLGPMNVDKLISVKNFSTTSYDYTPYLTGLKWNNINQLWKQIKKSSDFEKRKKAIDKFNKENKWRKKGICMMPLKYGISFNGPRGLLNQGGAYVLAYAGDASVLVHHGGVEMGQGIQTKMAQIAAETLGIPIEYIKMAETNTEVINNASPTAASTGSDLNGGAVQMACLQLRKRLEQMCIDLENYSLYFAQSDFESSEELSKLKLRKGSYPSDQSEILKVRTIVRNWRNNWAEVWPMIVQYAYMGRIDLSASARYQAPHHEVVDNSHPIGRPFFYFTYSVAVSEVVVDILTGEFETLRTDILFDIGKSLNPLIDVGQLEGAFVQGLGYLTTEEIIKQGPKEARKDGIPNGAITSVNTWNYKPPGSKTIPTDFRITIFDDRLTPEERQDPNLEARAIKSSKGIGEPPLVLANSVFFAIKQAILAFYKDTGHKGWVEMTAPATIQKIQSACNVAIKEMTI